MWYFPNGSIKKRGQYEKGKKIGDWLEYNEAGEIITELQYEENKEVEKQSYNRLNKEGEKTGIWREFYPNGKLKSEISYMNGKEDGLHKEFDKKGKLVILERKILGEVDTATGVNLLDLYESFHDNGNLALIGGLKDGLKQGVYRSYDENGNLVNGIIYEKDTVVGKGTITSDGIYLGEWIWYYTNGNFKAKGSYEKGVKQGLWEYYFPNGKIEQKGKFIDGKQVGNWIWYYKNGQTKRTEFYNGKSLLEGTVTEYDSLGKEITRGEYYEGKREGDWFYHVNDYKEVGVYSLGYKHGIWKGYYENGKLYSTGEFVDGEPKGKHVFFHKNGLKKYEGKYVGGLKHGGWKRYDEMGFEVEHIVYKQGEIYKINGFKVVPVE